MAKVTPIKQPFFQRPVVRQIIAYLAPIVITYVLNKMTGKASGANGRAGTAVRGKRKR